MVDIEMLKYEIVERLKPLDPDQIILFGSYAYGVPNEDSDIDLCIVKPSITSKIAEKTKIRKLLKDIKISKDILVERSDFFKEHTSDNWINTTLYDAAHKGLLLYAKK